MKPLTRAEENVLFFAMRYALGRRTTAPSIVVGEIVAKWPRIGAQTRGQMKEEIVTAISRGDAGDDCDVVEWQKVLELSMEKTP